MSQAEKKKKGLVIIIGLLAITLITYVAVSYQMKHSHRASNITHTPKRQVVESVAQQNMASNSTSTNTVANTIAATTHTTDEGSASSLPADAQLPSTIPPAMLKAMQERGMSVDELRNGGKAKGSAMSGMSGSAMSEKNMGEGQFPEAMQKALAEQQANTQAPKDNATQSTTPQMKMQAPQTEQFPPFIYQAVKHVQNHKIKEQMTLLDNNLNAIIANPNDVQALVSTSDIFLKHNEIQGSKYFLEKATIVAPSDAHIAYIYGQTLTKNFESEEAAKQWERSLSIQDNPHVRLDLARLYRYQLNQPELAKESLKKALTLPNLSSSLRNEIQRELDR